ncbi:putative alpha/beta hydrolase [Hypoxylon sp. FL1284]|nr:putative alpha/beta hydrolase [Hypoxylon sp. FL1284]
MATTQTVQVAHLNANVGYAIAGGALDPSRPTCALVTALCTTAADFYAAQLASEQLAAAAANIVALEPLGHGATTCDDEDNFTAWDQARVALQALEALGVEKFCLAGTSQGGWIVVRMALLAPEKVQGLVLVSTSMDCESADSRSKGCWDPIAFAGPHLKRWTSDVATPGFVAADDFILPTLGLVLGSAITAEATEFWTQIMRRVYSGDSGRHRLKAALIAVVERDGLLLRIDQVKCPIHWLHGVNDPVFSATLAKENIKMFTGSPEAKIDIIDSDSHFLVATHGKEIDQAILDIMTKV